jgi:hypothetical protein
VIVAALYAARSVLRGSWRLELPMDAVILVMVAVVMVVVYRLRDIAEREEDCESELGASRDNAEGPKT